MQEDDISDSSSSRTISNVNEGDGDEGDNVMEETSDEETSNQEHDSEGSSSTNSVSNEDPNKPKVTEGKAQLSPRSQKEKFRLKIKEVAREIAKEEASKAKKAEEKKQGKGTADGAPVKSPRVKSVAQKRSRMVVDEESSSEDLSDTSPLKQRRSKKFNDPLFSQ